MGSDLSARRRLAARTGQHFGGDRDLYEVMGYPRHLTAEDYAETYLRQDIAARVVDSYPDSTWREPPTLYGDDAFMQSFEDIESRHHIFRSMHRLDRLTGLGHYGVLLLGLDGAESLHQPVRESGGYGLIYLQPHSERTAEITQWEDDPTSPRYGKPKLYRITTGVNWTGAGATQRTATVHHSRVIHVAERALEDVSIGTPRLERVYNRLMDMDKLAGGSAEMYWQNSAIIMALIAEADVEWSPDEREAMQDQIEDMQHGLRRWMRLRGVDPKNLAPGLQGADPTGHMDKQLDLIAGATGIPKRILIGSERGELSSSQDEFNWASRIDERREQFAGPGIIEPFVRAGQRLGFLNGSFDYAEWPAGNSVSEDAQADIALKRTQALSAYVNTVGADMIVSPAEVREWLGMEPNPAPTPGGDDYV